MSAEAHELRPSGIEAAGDLPWGSHFAVFYTSKPELLEVLFPFVAAGLGSGEMCCWEVEAPLTVGEVNRALADSVPDLEAFRTRGQLVVEPAADRAEGDGEAMIERRLDRAMLAGFAGLRLVCHAQNDRAMPLGGAAAHHLLNVVTAVLYARAALDAAAFMRVVQNHRFALVAESGHWQVLQGSEAHNARDALARTEEKLHALFENMSEGFAYHRIVLDARGRPCDYVFLETNPAFDRLAGLDSRKIRGRRVTEVLPGIESDPTDWIGKYGRVALTGEPLQFEGRFEAADKWYSVSAFCSHKGYFAVTFSDVTDRKRNDAERERAEAALRQSRADLETALARERDARREAEVANRAKDDFLAGVSHELRSPLNTILGWAVMLRSDRPLDEATRRQALDAIERGARAQRQLIDDLLDLARITSGRLRLDVRPVELIPVMEAAVDAARPMADAKQIRLGIVADPKAALVSGDPDRLQQVFWNLLSNAIKFTERGGEVLVRLERVASHVEIVVSDNGVGIDAELLPRVFDRFRQGPGGRRAGGLGLGLAIVRQLVELHGGTVRAESEGPGQGATFTVCLPLRAVRPEPAVPAPVPETTLAASPVLRGVRVLAVDDEQETRAVLQAMLEAAGAEARVVDSAAVVLDALAGGRWDVLVSDIEMPECDGYTLIQRVRERGWPIPAVALTAHARTQDRVRAITAGFDIHVAKPVEPAELLAVVGSLAARVAPTT
jgi:signal transduction histidine kinase